MSGERNVGGLVAGFLSTLMVIAFVAWILGAMDDAGALRLQRPETGVEAGREMELAVGGDGPAPRPLELPGSDGLSAALLPAEPQQQASPNDGHFAVRVTDLDGRAIPDALVWPVSGNASRIGRVDAQGHLRWPTAQPPAQFHVSAPGYALAGVRRDGSVWQLDSACEPRHTDVCVDSWRSARLLRGPEPGRSDWGSGAETVRLPRVTAAWLDVERPGLPSGWIYLVASADPVQSVWPSSIATELGMGVLASAAWGLDWDGERTVSRALVMANDNVLVAGLTAGLDVSVNIEGHHLAVISQELAEWARVAIEAEDSVYELAGTVRDASGRPVPKASVTWLRGNAWGMLAVDAAGAFRFGDVLAADVDVVVYVDGVLRGFEPRVQLPVKDLVLELTDPDRVHTFEFVDATTGATLELDAAAVCVGSAVRVHASPVDATTWRVDVPHGLAWDIVGRMLGEPVVAPMGPGAHSTVEVACGSLVVSWAPERAPLGGVLRLVRDDWGPYERRVQRSAASGLELPVMLARDYVVELALSHGSTQVVARGEITVVPGGEHHLHLEPVP